MNGSAMHRMIARKPQPGERIDALTGEAIELWFATERDRRRLDWIAEQIGAGLEAAWRCLGLAVGRCEIFTAEGRLCWQPMPPDARLGEPAIVVPRWIADEDHWGGMTIFDMIAIDPRNPHRVASRTGACEALGEIETAFAIQESRPIVWHRDGMSWLRGWSNAKLSQRRGNKDANVKAYRPDQPVRFLPIGDRTEIAERVLLFASEIFAEDNELWNDLVELRETLRERLVPKRAPIVVADRIDLVV